MKSDSKSQWHKKKKYVTDHSELFTVAHAKNETLC